MGIGDDPDVNDYYTKTCGFPMTYSPGDDPEVMEEMQIAAVELKNGDCDEVESVNESSREDKTASEDGREEGVEESWVDQDDKAGELEMRKQKTLTSIDKVRAA
jgi:hypothetical protein